MSLMIVAPETPEEKVERQKKAEAEAEAFKKAWPARASLKAGPNSVLSKAPATEPHNWADLLEKGLLLKHPSGRFVAP